VKLKTIYGRPRIDRLLGQCGDYPLTVIVAGAGYGKTTAVAEFLKKTDVHHMLLTLTSSDEDVLWDKLCSGMESCCKETSDHLRILGLPASSWTRSRTVKLAREACKAPFILCIDDYQLLPEDSSVHTLIETVAFEKIDNLHIILLSRSQPNIRIGTLVSKEMALCIDADDLAFDVKETNGYLAMRGLRLTQERGGWAFTRPPAAGSPPFTCSARACAPAAEIGRGKGIDALFEENLLRLLLPEIDRDMLYRLSAFDSFPLPMAVAALGMERFRRRERRR
jgi:LuxR family maltose regulon positive regulatory protein